MWDLSSGDLCHSLRGHTGPVSGATFLKWNPRLHKGAFYSTMSPLNSEKVKFLKPILTLQWNGSKEDNLKKKNN